MMPAMPIVWPLLSIIAVFVRVTVRVAGEEIVPPACSVPPVKISVLVALPSPSASVALALRVPTLIVVGPE